MFNIFFYNLDILYLIYFKNSFYFLLLYIRYILYNIKRNSNTLDFFKFIYFCFFTFGNIFRSYIFK
jgi:hypothetical protein